MTIAKPAYTTSLVYIKANEVLPPTLLHKLLSENRSAVGLCVRNDKGLDVEKFGDVGKETVDANFKTFSGIITNTKKFSRLLTFHNFPEGFDSGEIQPWSPIKDSKGNPLVTVACEGDFVGQGVDGLHSEFYGLMYEYLGPKIEEMYGMFSNDPSKLDAFLRSKSFAKDLEAKYGHRAVFEFMPTVGEPYTHGKNTEGLEATWGRCSFAYGYSEAAAEAATPISEPVTNRVLSKYADPEDAPAPAAAPAAPTPAAPVPAVPLNNPPTADPIAAAADKTVNGHYEAIPANLHGKRRKSFIRGLMNGDLPKGHENLTRIWVNHEQKVSSLEELPKLGVTGSAPKDMKAAEPTLVKDKAEESHPVISGTQQAAAIEFIGKYLDSSSNKITNPLEAQKEEARYPVFSELMKAKLPNGLDDLERLPVTALLSFIKQHPETMWLAVLEYRRDRINRKLSAAVGDKKLVELVGTENPTKTTPAAAPEKTGIVSQPDQAARLMSKYA